MKHHGKVTTFLLWTTTYMMAILFVTAGAYKLADGMDAQFDQWGFPPGFDASIGMLELFAGVCLLSARSAGWSAFGLMVLMLSAFEVHLMHGELFAMIIPLVVFALLGFVAWGHGLPFHTRVPRRLAPAVG